MICNNCGYHFKNSLTCPLCGQSYKKKKVCPVCQKRIHYNQIRCNNCGNPLIKQSTTDVSKYYVNNHNFPKNNKTTVNYNNQKTTNSSNQKIINVHTNSKSKTKIPSFQPLEMYDYKIGNEEIKRRFEEARNALNFRRDRRKKKTNKSRIPNIIAGLTLLITVGGFLFEILINFIDNDFSFEETTTERAVLSDDFTTANITETNTPLENAGNYNQDNHVYFNNDQIYLGYEDNVYVTDNELATINTLTVPGSTSLYVEGDNLYCGYYDEYYCYNLTNQEEVFLFNKNTVLPIGQGRFIYTTNSNNELYLYSNNTSTCLYDDYTYGFFFDANSELVYLADGEKIQTMDLNGNVVGEYYISCYSNFYVDGSLLYYQSIYGVNVYNLSDDSESIQIEDSLYEFTVVDDGIVYLDDNENLMYYNFEDESYTEIVDGVDSFNILGEYVLFNRYDSGYSWYIATTDGQICSLDTLMN